ncbi:MAG TPA: hypothetical protein VJ456_17950 [Acidimicrobiia bacterium]|nr:hypothetical protein [Acidimicrobiia bacterium]
MTSTSSSSLIRPIDHTGEVRGESDGRPGAGGANQSDAALTTRAERIAGHHRGHGHHHVAQTTSADLTGGALFDVRA